MMGKHRKKKLYEKVPKVKNHNDLMHKEKLIIIQTRKKETKKLLNQFSQSQTFIIRDVIDLCMHGIKYQNDSLWHIWNFLSFADSPMW